MGQLANETIPETSASDCAAQLLEVTPLLMHHIRREMRRRAAPGLTLPQFRTLAYLRRHPSASLNDVAEHLGVSAPTASKLVQKLVVHKVVTRSVAADRRRVGLSVTDLGKAMLKKARLGTHKQLAAGLASLSPRKLATVSAALRTLGQAFSQGGTNVNLS